MNSPGPPYLGRQKRLTRPAVIFSHAFRECLACGRFDQVGSIHALEWVGHYKV
jgi:hypothetical protein